MMIIIIKTKLRVFIKYSATESLSSPKSILMPSVRYRQMEESPKMRVIMNSRPIKKGFNRIIAIER